jgi:hypothetical protein
MFYKSRTAENESSAKAFTLALWHQAKQSALQKPEFLNIMPSSQRSSAGRTRVDVFVQQLNFAERSGCWSPCSQAFRHGSHLLRKRAIWPAKQQPFTPPGIYGGDFNF